MGFGFEIPQKLLWSINLPKCWLLGVPQPPNPPTISFITQCVTISYWVKHVETPKLRQSCKFITRSSSWMMSHKMLQKSDPKKKAAAQCSHVQALMCFSRLSAVQCFLHSLHCTSRVTSGNHDLPHGWNLNLQSRLYVANITQTLYFCIFPGNLGGSKITGSFGAFRWGHFFLWLFKDVSTRWWPEANGVNVLGGCCGRFPPKKKRDSQIQENAPTPLDQPTVWLGAFLRDLWGDSIWFYKNMHPRASENESILLTMLNAWKQIHCLWISMGMEVLVN